MRQLRLSSRLLRPFGAPISALLFVLVGSACTESQSVPAAPSDPCPPELDAVVADRGFVGIQLVVDRPGEPVCARAFGRASLRPAVAMTLDHGIHWGSVTKQVTAAAVLRLVDQGRLALDDHLTDLLDRADVRALPHATEVTVGQLLDHSSGFYAPNNHPDYLAALVGSREEDLASWTRERFLQAAAEEEPLGLPGSGHYYSDTNYLLLGLIVERVAGRPLSDHVRETIFGPLGIESTFYLSDVPFGGDSPTPTARGHLRMSEVLEELVAPGRFETVADGVLDSTASGERLPGSAALVGPVGDLHRFALAYFRGDLLSPASRDLVLSVADAVDGEEPGSRRQRIASASRQPYGTVITAEGDGPGGTNSIVAYHPATETIVVALVNQFGAFDETDFVVEHLVADAVSGIASPEQ